MMISFTFVHILNKRTPAYDGDVSVFYSNTSRWVKCRAGLCALNPGSRMNLLGLL